jgi:gluconolactonase
LLIDDFGQLNGLVFSLDEKQLHVNDTDRQTIRLFEVLADGNLANGRVWAQTTGEGAGAPDGMKIDCAGNIYCSGPGGIHVFAPDATCLGVIRMAEYTTNFCFGDDDLRSLYITASRNIVHQRSP